VNNQERKQIVLKQIASGDIGKKQMKKAGQAIGAAVGLVVGGLLIATGVGAAMGIKLVGWGIVSFLAASVAVGASIGGLFQENKPPEFGGFDYQADSPTYSFGPLTHTISNQLPVAVIYGRMKVAGNVIWQSDPAETVQRIQCICNGVIESISDVRVNDIGMGDTATVDKEILLKDPNATYYYPTKVVQSDFVLYGNNNVAIGTNLYRFDGIKVVWNGVLERLLAMSQGGGSDVFKGSYTAETLPGCSYTAYLGTTTQTVDARAAGKVAGLKRTAYLAYTLKSGEKLRGGNPVVTCIVEGTKIKTWDGSSWTGSTYSRNPAACIRDFLTNEIYGVGIPETWLDDASFGEVSEYCDEEVDNGLNDVENRFVLDFVIDTSRPALDILNDMLCTFMGFLSVSGEKIKLGVEKSDAVVVQALTMDNIISGSFGYSQAGKDDLPNKVMIQYIDPDYEWQKIYALAENKLDQDSRADLLVGRSVIEKKLAIFGITRFTQASRLARRFLRMATYSSTYCTVSVGIDCIACEVGDVVTVTHDVPDWTAKPFRILSIEETEKDVLRLLMREYVEQIYDDEFGSVRPVMDYGSPQNPYKPLVDVANITISEGVGYVDWDGKYISRINCTWDHIATGLEQLSHYEVKLSKAGGDYIDVGTTRGNSFAIDVSETYQAYTVKVVTVSTEDLDSTGAISNAIILYGKTTPPSSVQYFNVEQFEEQLVFQWYPITDRDFAYYELRSGESWDSGKLIDTIFVGTQYKLSYFQFGLTKYWLKAYDMSGNQSSVAAFTSIVVTRRPKMNLVAFFSEYVYADTPLSTWRSENISDEWENLYDATYNRRVYDGKTYHRWDTFAASWEEAEASMHYGWDSPRMALPITPTNYVVYNWEFPTIDLGANIKFMMVFYEKILHTPGVFVYMHYRHSEDGVTWTDWVLYAPGFIQARYVELRGTIIAYEMLAGYGMYYDALATIDMIDIRYSMKDIEIGSAGTYVEFDEPFTVVPTVVATALDNDGTTLIPVIDNSEIYTTGISGVQVTNISGTPVDGLMNLHLEGY
jgi:hypothetical protein